MVSLQVVLRSGKEGFDTLVPPAGVDGVAQLDDFAWLAEPFRCAVVSGPG